MREKDKSIEAIKNIELGWSFWTSDGSQDKQFDKMGNLPRILNEVKITYHNG
ncbi:MAG: hypothetical protein GY702_19495 [Desulfobulbaceae bacterium]|nr:hypothetical protein [Desulfobulbaceae bacterium]